ncbi:MAG: hypothetical protein Q4E64_03905 [Phascolarctobacterium sp.]|uniref:hypothetical protein n=1 Tax=Phascolarctobacterium sp. TaxID=2049039 RepID=UPI0026DCD0D4|nr:hypothetical protein [Phascolarctobacterium sp.]MDO4920958.1 hypothetical protein [Phascolarctobacterium sp.]
MIRVKPLISGWHTVTKEQALRFARHLYSGIVNVSEEAKLDFINQRVTGIKFTHEDLR